MSALLDAYQAYLKNNQTPPIPQTSAVPPELATSYYKDIQTPMTVPQPAGLQDIPSAVSEGYKTGGIPLAVLAGLGKTGEFLASKTGNQILAGTSKSPYLAQGYLNNAEVARQNELAQRTNAFQMNLEKQKEQGEAVRSSAQQAAELKKTQLQNQLEMPLKLLTLQNEQNKTGIEGQKATTEAANQETERQQKAQEIALAGRNWFSKVFGGKPDKMVAQNSMGHSIVSYDGGKTWQ